MVSIIVPIYKAEAYIRRCIDSIFCQKYQDWELLLIDDGSPDNSGLICDEYAEKDSRVRAIHKQNGGVSSARNCGLDNAVGEWICFIDADDYIVDDYFSCVEMCEEDLIINKHAQFYQNSICSASKYYFSRMIISKPKELQTFLSYYSNDKKIRTPWAKIFRRDKIGTLRFNENMRIGEDTNFVFRFFEQMPTVLVANTGTYMYLVSECDDRIKYGLSSETALFTLHQIFDVYHSIGAPNKELDHSMFSFFRYVCTSDDSSMPSSWLNDALVLHLKQSSCSFLESTICERIARYLKQKCLISYCDMFLLFCKIRYFVRYYV